MKNLAMTLLAATVLSSCGEDQAQSVQQHHGAQAGTPAVELSPAAWPEGEWDKYVELEGTAFPGNPEAVGKGGAISGSYHPLAQRAGLEALARGGSSVDAALTTAMAQITAGAGAVTSFFGIMTLVHYDAESGEVSYMNAGWNTVAGENDPMGIPGEIAGYGKGLYGTGDVSGRTALVGGFLRGVESAHGRFGKLPFEELFAPSIYIAEHGIPFNQSLQSYLEPRKADLARLPASKAVLTKENGDWFGPGDNFVQPALAATLRTIAEEGVDYMYTGAWARKAVTAIQADGGKMSLEDLAAYEVQWNKPLKATHNGYTIYANGAPSYGGANMIEALHLGEAAGIRELGHWSENAETFRRVCELLGNGSIPFIEAFAPDSLEQLYPGLDFSLEARTKAAHAEKLWSYMEEGRSLIQWDDKGLKHSDTVVAVDAEGSMTAVVHSINAVVWGKTAIIVDGVSIGDPAVSQKAIVAMAGPGNRLPDPTEAGLLFKNGEPVLAFSSMAMGLHLETFQSLTNVMDFGMTPKEALDAPSILYPRIEAISDMNKAASTVRVMRGAFPTELLEKTGLPYMEIEPEERRYAQGLWVGIARDPDTGRLRAASHPYTNGRALALEKKP